MQSGGPRRPQLHTYMLRNPTFRDRRFNGFLFVSSPKPPRSHTVCAHLSRWVCTAPQGSAGPDSTDACAVAHKRMFTCGRRRDAPAARLCNGHVPRPRSASARGVRPVPARAPAQFYRGSRGWLPAPLRRVRSIEDQDGALEMPVLESSCVARCHVWHRCGHQNQGVSLSGRCRSAPSAAGP